FSTGCGQATYRCLACSVLRWRSTGRRFIDLPPMPLLAMIGSQGDLVSVVAEGVEVLRLDEGLRRGRLLAHLLTRLLGGLLGRLDGLGRLLLGGALGVADGAGR